MNHDNHKKTAIDHALEQSADTPVPPEVQARLRARLVGFREKLESQGSKSPRPGRHWVLRSAVGMAAVLALGFAVWISMAPTITLADVQAAIEKRPWSHIVFDNGGESWTSLAEHKRFSKGSDGVLRVIDYVDNKMRSYQPGSDEISQETYIHLPDGRPLPDAVILAPKNPLETTGLTVPLLSVPEGEVADFPRHKQISVQRHIDTVEGQRLFRFDTYRKGYLGHTYLDSQIWVDPKTRLPVRVRYRLSQGRAMSGDAFTEGRYDFPDTGPADIYALGAPRDAQIVNPTEPATEAIKQCLDAIEQADQRWPERYRVVQWPVVDRSSSKSLEFHVSWWNGQPTDRHYLTDDYRGVKIRSERFIPAAPWSQGKYEGASGPLSVIAEQILASREEGNQVVERIQICDGEKYFTFRKSGSGGGATGFDRVSVESKLGLLGYSFDERPGYYLWPCADIRPPTKLVTDGPELKPGTVMLTSRGAKYGGDYHIDPAHDMICIKRTWWKKRDDKWVKSREHKVLEMDQLPDGRWFATKRKLTIYDDPEEDVHGDTVIWNVDVKVLDEGDFPPGIFDGQKMLEEAEAAGAKIETR